MRDLKSLKPIDRRFLIEYIKNGGNKTQAAAKVKRYDLKDEAQYHAAASWGVDAYRRVQPNVEEEMEIAGLSLNAFMQTLRDGLKAVKILRDNQGNILQIPHPQTGQTVSAVDPDFRVRHLYMDSGLKLLGAYAPQKHEVTGKDGGPIQQKQIPVLDLSALDGDELALAEKLGLKAKENGTDGDT